MRQISRTTKNVVRGTEYPTKNFYSTVDDTANLKAKLAWAAHYKQAAEHLVSIKPPEAAADVDKTNREAMSPDRKAVETAYPSSIRAARNSFVDPALGLDIAAKTDAALAKGDATRLPAHLRAGSVPLPRDYAGTILPGTSLDEHLYTGVSAADAVSNAWLANRLNKNPLGAMAQTLIQYGPQAWVAARGALDTAGVIPMMNLQQTSTIGDASLEAQAIANRRLNTGAAWAANPDKAAELSQQADRLDKEYRELSESIQRGERKSDLSKGIFKSQVASTIDRVASVGSDVASVMLALKQGGPAAVGRMAATSGGVGAAVAALSLLGGGSPADAALMAAKNVTPSLIGWRVASSIASKAGTELGAKTLAAGLGRAMAAPIALAAQVATTVTAGVPTDRNKAAFDEKLRVQAYADALEGKPPGGDTPWLRGAGGAFYAAVDPQNPLLSSTGAVSDAAHAQYMEHYKVGQDIARHIDTQQQVRNELVTTWSRSMPANYVERISNDVAGLAVLHKDALTDPEYKQNFDRYVGDVREWASNVPVSTRPGEKAFGPEAVERIVRFTANYGPDAFAMAYFGEQSQLPPAVHHNFRNWINNG